jgi:hypothetical protein
MCGVGKKKQIQSWCRRIVNVTACILRAGIAAGLEFMMSSPEPLLNKINKVEVNKQKPSDERPAQTKAQ